MVLPMQAVPLNTWCREGSGGSEAKAYLRLVVWRLQFRLSFVALEPLLATLFLVLYLFLLQFGRPFFMLVSGIVSPQSTFFMSAPVLCFISLLPLFGCFILWRGLIDGRTILVVLLLSILSFLRWILARPMLWSLLLFCFKGAIDPHTPFADTTSQPPWVSTPNP